MVVQAVTRAVNSSGSSYSGMTHWSVRVSPGVKDMAAAHMMLGQTEKTLRMAPNERFIGQRKTLPTMKPLNDFQARHSFYPSSRVVVLITPGLSLSYRHCTNGT